jgi:hypothetical protein
MARELSSRMNIVITFIKAKAEAKAKAKVFSLLASA